MNVAQSIVIVLSSFPSDEVTSGRIQCPSEGLQLPRLCPSQLFVVDQSGFDVPISSRSPHHATFASHGASEGFCPSTKTFEMSSTMLA